MMGGSTAKTETATATGVKPNQLALLLHLRKTFALISAVLSDGRVHWMRKTLFLSTITVLIASLIGVDFVNEFIDSIIVPFFGTFLGIPLDGTFDWIALAVAAYNLLKLFPADIVGEHYDRLFRSGKAA